MLAKKLCRLAFFSRITLPKVCFSTEAESASFTVKDFKLHRFDNYGSVPSTTVTVTKEDGLKYYKEMQSIRRMESEANKMYKEKLIRGFCHLYNGQEACAVGIEASITKSDPVITAYRAHGWAHTRGVPFTQVLAELTGRVSGVVHGRGGSMHMYNYNFFGGNGIVGAQVPLGAGIAFAHKYNNTGNICVTLYGDGAANQGQVFETYNIAKLWNLPVLFICENNKYGMGTSVDRAAASTSYHTRGDYIPGIWANGMDVLAVREATRFAAEYIRAGNGPVLMEVETYRYYGHSMSDPGTSYRTRDEIDKVRKTQDPITSFRERLLKAGLVTNDECKKIDKEVRAAVDAAVKVARTDAVLPPEELYSFVYANDTTTKHRGADGLYHKGISKVDN